MIRVLKYLGFKEDFEVTEEDSSKFQHIPECPYEANIEPFIPGVRIWQDREIKAKNRSRRSIFGLKNDSSIYSYPVYFVEEDKEKILQSISDENIHDVKAIIAYLESIQAKKEE